MNEPLRLFFAAPLKSEIICCRLLPQMKEAFRFDSIAWANPEQMHLTLKFFGDTPQYQIPVIETALSHALKKHSPFNIVLKHVKIFGSRYKPQVIWMGIEDDGSLRKLFFDVKRELEQAGFKDDRQNFVPHLTLGRIKKIDNLQRFQSALSSFSTAEAEQLHVNECVLFESRLLKTGAVHIPLKKFSLD